MTKTRTIPAGQFKSQCLKLMDEVNRTHRSILITKRGLPVAKLIPMDQEKVSFFGCMEGTAKITGNIIDPIDESWEADED